MPVLAQQPLYDAKMFTSRNTTATAADSAFVADVRLRIEAGLSSAQVIVGSACDLPGAQASFTKNPYFTVKAGDGGFKSGLYKLVHYTNQSVSMRDTCQTVNCNPSCPAD